MTAVRQHVAKRRSPAWENKLQALGPRARDGEATAGMPPQSRDDTESAPISRLGKEAGKHSSRSQTSCAVSNFAQSLHGDLSVKRPPRHASVQRFVHVALCSKAWQTRPQHLPTGCTMEMGRARTLRIRSWAKLSSCGHVFGCAVWQRSSLQPAYFSQVTRH
jgi:hypothetical protein